MLIETFHPPGDLYQHHSPPHLPCSSSHLSNWWINMEGGKMLSVVVGPWGGGGSSWDDGSYSGVREITICYGWCIDSIRVVYDKNGEPVSGDKHGGSGGQSSEIKLQYPEEKLIGVSGHYHPFWFCGPVIRSLTFNSNRRTFGPFGAQVGTPFSLTTDGGQIVGFQGRSGWYLDAIGFRWSGTDPSTKLLSPMVCTIL
ncbi:hypothetical protein PVL29_011292 [Vitis rotundifolia]|uniref:Jacalin-type lectin domain-containing protein n=2 Tax=Vitis rotundifolia TaxID=103349 RepID=A0AA38ZN47_VITRO|nr:hypothetical protein PVL29_011292 [Vitis rotundifolia]